MTQPAEARATIRLSLTALAISAMSLSGCAHMYENVELGKTSLPPNFPHAFEAPVNYGYFPTLWRAWPGAEAVPGQSASSGQDDEKEAESTAETLPEPSTETAPESGVEPGMENIFDLPEGMQGEQPEGEAQPGTGEPLPDTLIPPENEAAAVPEASATPEEPTTPEQLQQPEAEAIPDQLIPNEGGAPPPESASMTEPRDLENLPFDAPEGDLIPETPRPVAAKPRPGLLMPVEPRRPSGTPRIENALRPGVRQGAKAVLSPPNNALRELSRGNVNLAPTAEDAFMDGPQLTAQSPNADAVATVSAEQAPRSSEVSPTLRQTTRMADRPRVSESASTSAAVPTVMTTADGESNANWRPSRGRAAPTENPAIRSTAAREPNRSPRQAVRGDYPAVQAGHTESRTDTPATSGSLNPLR